MFVLRKFDYSWSACVLNCPCVPLFSAMMLPKARNGVGVLYYECSAGIFVKFWGTVRVWDCEKTFFVEKC